MERGLQPPSPELLYGLAQYYPSVDLRELLYGEPIKLDIKTPDATEVAARVRPIIRPLGALPEDLPEDVLAEEYFAVPLLEGRVAAGPGAVVWDEVQSLVWVYRPELGRRINLVAVKVSGKSMEPTIPDKAIVIIDRDQWLPNGKLKSIWAIRTDLQGDVAIKRLQATPKGMMIISDNYSEYPPELAWTDDLRELVVGRVIWMWRSME